MVAVDFGLGLEVAQFTTWLDVQHSFLFIIFHKSFVNNLDYIDLYMFILLNDHIFFIPFRS